METSDGDLHPPQVPPLQLLQGALNDVATNVVLEELSGGTSHTAIVANGLQEPVTTRAFGRFLLGTLASAVDIDAQLCEQMLAQGAEARVELEALVGRLIGNTNVFETDEAIKFRDTRRNAWIAEGVVHALLVVRAHRETPFLTGPVHALKQPHAIPSQQGLDAIAVYSDNGTAVVAIGESKATRLDGSGQLTAAAQMFQEIDNGDYAVEIRAELMALRRAIPLELASQLKDSLWRNSRCYFPVILHEKEFDPLGARPTLERLAPSIERKRLLALRLRDFHGFFNAVADAMRSALPEVVI